MIQNLEIIIDLLMIREENPEKAWPGSRNHSLFNRIIYNAKKASPLEAHKASLSCINTRETHTTTTTDQRSQPSSYNIMALHGLPMLFASSVFFLLNLFLMLKPHHGYGDGLSDPQEVGLCESSVRNHGYKCHEIDVRGYL